MRRRKHYRKQQGHRQNYTELFIGRIASALGEARAEIGTDAVAADAAKAEVDTAAGQPVSEPAAQE